LLAPPRQEVSMNGQLNGKLIALSLTALLAAPAFARTDNYTVDPEATIPAFEIKRLGFSSASGRFNQSSGKLTLNFATKSGSVDFTIHTASIDMSMKYWSNQVADEGLLNVKAYPSMNFRSNKLIFDGEKVVAAEGQFTLLGITKPLRVTVNNFSCSTNPANNRSMCAGDIKGSFRRSDFGMKKYIPAVSDEVDISVPLEAYKD
jgi:polyisoprenoid-binding protein YceI